jgi:hypothetical protein
VGDDVHGDAQLAGDVLFMNTDDICAKRKQSCASSHRSKMYLCLDTCKVSSFGLYVHFVKCPLLCFLSYNYFQIRFCFAKICIKYACKCSICCFG